MDICKQGTGYVFGRAETVPAEKERPEAAGIMVIFRNSDRTPCLMCRAEINGEQRRCGIIDMHKKMGRDSLFDIFRKYGADRCFEEFSESDASTNRYIMIERKDAAGFFKCFGTYRIRLSAEITVDYMNSSITLSKGIQTVGGEIVSALVYGDIPAVQKEDILNQITDDILSEKENADNSFSESLSYVSGNLSVVDIIEQGYCKP